SLDDRDRSLDRWRRWLQMAPATIAVLWGIRSALFRHGPQPVHWLDFGLMRLSPGAIVAPLLAWAFRGGPLMRLVGIRVRTVDGRPASRVRCLVRALWAAIPGLAILLPHLVGGALLASRGEFAM